MNEIKIYKELLNNFKNHITSIYGEDRGFAYDGPVNSDNWFRNNNCLKTLFLLKETYGYDGDDIYKIMDSPDVGRFNDSRTNRNISKLAYGLREISKLIDSGFKFISNENLYGLIDPIFDAMKIIDKDTLKDCYADTAIIQIKKLSGSSKSSDPDIRKHSKESGHFLSQQIKLLNPNIIICGGKVTWQSLIEDLNVFKKQNFHSNERGINEIDNIIIYNSYHPSYSLFNSYDILFDICKTKSLRKNPNALY